MTDQPVYTNMLRPVAPGYRSDQVVPQSHYSEPIEHAPGRLAGRSRRGGDASPEVQSRVIDLLIEKGRGAGLSSRDIAIVLAIAGHESGFNPDAAAGTTSAFGLGQFVNDTGAHYGLGRANRGDAAAQAGALVAHFIDNKRLAQGRGQGEEFIYKYHHDGPTRDYGGLGISRQHVMTYVDRYEAFVDAWMRDRGLAARLGGAQPAATGQSNPLADGILKRGENGDAVLHLQQRLNAQGLKGLDGRPIDTNGHFGANTQAALREFQKTHGLPVTGEANAATRVALERAPARQAPAPQHGNTQSEVGFTAAMRRVLPPQSGVAPHITAAFHEERGAVDHQGVDFNYVGGQNGINLRHPTVGAPATGTVVFVGGQYGTVRIRDAQGNVHEILHLQTQSVREGHTVQAGDPIGTMGGRGPNGPDHFAQHVHYQLRDPQNRIIDPVAFWNDPRHRALAARGDPAHATAPPAPADAMADGRLEFGDRGAAVRQLQLQLNDYGIRDADGRPLPPTGNFLDRTRAAVHEFQRTYGLPETGVGDAATLAAIAKSPEIKRGDQGADVLHVQQMLERAGIVVPSSGTFTYLTEGAVKEFQAAHGLDPTGVVRGETLYRLRQAAEQAPAPARTPDAATLPPPTTAPQAPVAANNHPLEVQALSQIEILDRSMGRVPDAHTATLATLLAGKAQAEGMTRIDSVVLSTGRDRLIAVQGEAESRRMASIDIREALTSPAIAAAPLQPMSVDARSAERDVASRGMRIA